MINKLNNVMLQWKYIIKELKFNDSWKLTLPLVSISNQIFRVPLYDEIDLKLIPIDIKKSRYSYLLFFKMDSFAEYVGSHKKNLNLSKTKKYNSKSVRHKAIKIDPTLGSKIDKNKRFSLRFEG